ncbi:MAG: DUF494 domain-containing protein [Gammaproteobacteria bacterium]|nr:DUF494 domain-containing protein [Gammaproteobacteria bacterium]
MNTQVLDILMYLFDIYMDDMDKEQLPSEDDIRKELASIGFHHSTVDHAFNWLDELALLPDNISDKKDIFYEPKYHNSTRIFSHFELKKFSRQAQSILLELVILDMISISQRELIIEKAFALNVAHINQEQIKLIILMVLYNLPDLVDSYTWIQDHLYENMPTIH